MPEQSWHDVSAKPPYGKLVEGECSDGSIRPVYYTHSEKFVITRGRAKQGGVTGLTVVRWRSKE